MNLNKSCDICTFSVLNETQDTTVVNNENYSTLVVASIVVVVLSCVNVYWWCYERQAVSTSISGTAYSLINSNNKNSLRKFTL